MDLNKMRKSKDLFCELCICACVIERKRDTIILTVCLSLSMLGGGGIHLLKYLLRFSLFSRLCCSMRRFVRSLTLLASSTNIGVDKTVATSVHLFLFFIGFLATTSLRGLMSSSFLNLICFFPVEVHIRISPKIIKHAILYWNQIYKKGGCKHHIGPPPTTSLFYCTYTITCEFSFSLAKQVLVIAL